jgi:hypothetical protein
MNHTRAHEPTAPHSHTLRPIEVATIASLSEGKLCLCASPTPA